MDFKAHRLWCLKYHIRSVNIRHNEGKHINGQDPHLPSFVGYNHRYSDRMERLTKLRDKFFWFINAGNIADTIPRSLV